MVQAAKQMPQRTPMPTAPKAPMSPAKLSQRVWSDVLGVLGMESEHDRAMRAHRKQLALWRAEVREIREKNEGAWQTMQVAASLAPLARKRRVSTEIEPAPVPLARTIVPVRRQTGPRLP